MVIAIAREATARSLLRVSRGLRRRRRIARRVTRWARRSTSDRTACAHAAAPSSAAATRRAATITPANNVAGAQLLDSSAHRACIVHRDTHKHLRSTRRTFVRATSAAALSLPFARWRRRRRRRNASTTASRSGSPWPPPLQVPDEHPIAPPYLVDAAGRDSDRRRPPVVRRRFPDRDRPTCSARGTRATYHPANPILKPERPWELVDDAAERTEDSGESSGDGVQRRRLLRSEGSPVQDVVHGRLRRAHVPGDLSRRHRVDAPGVRRRRRGPTSSARRSATRARCGWISRSAIRSAATRCRCSTTSASSSTPRRMACIGRASAAPATPTIARRSSSIRSATCGASACAPISTSDRSADAIARTGSRASSRRRRSGMAAHRWRGSRRTHGILRGPRSRRARSSTTSTASPTKA